MLNTANYRHILLLELEQSLCAPGRPLKPRRKKKTIVSGYRKQQLDVCSPPSCMCRSSIVFNLGRARMGVLEIDLSSLLSPIDQ